MYICVYICVYIYLCNHENNVPSRLSPQCLFCNSCTVYDVDDIDDVYAYI